MLNLFEPGGYQVNILKKCMLFATLFSVVMPLQAVEPTEQSSRPFDALFSVVKKYPALSLMMGVAAATGIYLFKNVLSSKNTQSPEPDVTITQVPVLNQFQSAEHGGGASCGYQALKNAIYMSRSLCGMSLQEELTDLKIVQDLFNKQNPIGKWRSIILENTYKRSIKWMIDNALYRLLATDSLVVKNIPLPSCVENIDKKLQDRFKEKIRGFYQRVFADQLSPKLVNKVITLLQGKSTNESVDFVIRRSLLVTAIKETNLTMQHDIDGLENFDFESYAKSDAALSYYVPEFKHDMPIHPSTGVYVSISKQGALSGYNKKSPMSAFDTQGDWINEGEIKKLLELERQEGGLLTRMPHQFDGITIIDNVGLLEGNGEFAPREVNEIANRLSKAQDFVHGFVVGLMNGRPGFVNGERHWITLVVQKNAGKIEYFVADSGGNTDRVNHPIIRTLIKHIEAAQPKPVIDPWSIGQKGTASLTVYNMTAKMVMQSSTQPAAPSSKQGKCEVGIIPYQSYWDTQAVTFTSREGIKTFVWRHITGSTYQAEILLRSGNATLEVHENGKYKYKGKTLQAKVIN